MEKNEVIAVSGTPGTGKSAFAQILAEELDAKLINLEEVVEESGSYEFNSDGTRLVNSENLAEELKGTLSQEGNLIIVEGHLSHLLPIKQISQVVVLRTNPEELERRLRDRGYSGGKLRDNLEAEALGIILWEAVQNHGLEKVHEIDTTRKSASNAVDIFKKALEGTESLKPGEIDWLEEFF